MEVYGHSPMDWPRLLTSPPQIVPGEMERSKTLSFAATFGDEPPPANQDTFRRFDQLAAKIKTGKNLAKLLVVSDTLGVAVYITVEKPTSTQNAKGLLHKLFEHFGEQVTKRLNQTAHMLNVRDNERIQKMVGPETAHVQGCVRLLGWVCACASCAAKLPLPTPPDEVCVRERQCVCLLCAPEVTARQFRRRSKKKRKTALRTAEGALVLDWGCAHTVSAGELEVAACIRKQACSCRRCAPDPGAAGLKRPNKKNLREWYAAKEAADERERTQVLALPSNFPSENCEIPKEFLVAAAYESRGREPPAGLVALTAGAQALAYESRDHAAGLALTAGSDALAVEMPAAHAPRRLVSRAQALEAAREQLDQECKAAEASRKEAEARVHELSARLDVDCTLSLQDQLAKLSLNAEAREALEKEGASILKSLRERERLEEETIPELIDAVTTELQAARQQEESAVDQRCALVYMDYMRQAPLYMVEFMHEDDREGLILDRARPLVQEELRQLDELIENKEEGSKKAQRLRKEIVAKTTGAAVELVSQGVLPPYDKTKLAKEERSRFVQRVHKVLTGMTATVPKPGKRLKKGEECQEVRDCLGGIERDVCIRCQAHLSHAVSPVHWDQKTGRMVEKLPFATQRTLRESHIASLVAEREWLVAEPAGKPEKDIWRDEEALEKGIQQGAASLRGLDYFASFADASISYLRMASRRLGHWAAHPTLEADVKRIEDEKESRLRSASKARAETEQRIHSMKTRLGELRSGKASRKTPPAAGAKHEKLQAIDEEIAKYQQEAKTASNAKLPFRYADEHTSEFDSTVDALSFCSEMCLDLYLLSPVCPTCGGCVPADVNDPTVRAAIDARTAELKAEVEEHGAALHLAVEKSRAAPEEHRSEVEAAFRKMLDLAESLRAWTGAPNIRNTICCSSAQQEVSKVFSVAEARQRRQKQEHVERDSTLPAQSTDTVILDEDLKEKLGILRESSRQLQLVDAPMICKEHLVPMADRDPRRRAQLSFLTESPQV